MSKKSKNNTQEISSFQLLGSVLYDLFHPKGNSVLFDYESLALVSFNDLRIVDTNQLKLLHLPTLTLFLQYVGAMSIFLLVIDGMAYGVITTFNVDVGSAVEVVAGIASSPTAIRNDVGPAAIRNDVGPAAVRNDVGPAAIRNDVGPAVRNDSEEPAVRNGEWVSSLASNANVSNVLGASAENSPLRTAGSKDSNGNAILAAAQPYNPSPSNTACSFYHNGDVYADGSSYDMSSLGGDNFTVCVEAVGNDDAVDYVWNNRKVSKCVNMDRQELKELEDLRVSVINDTGDLVGSCSLALEEGNE